MTDFLIVGAGLAGIAFAEIALREGRSVFVIDSGQRAASEVAGGLYNPVVLKRLRAVADAQSHLDAMNAFYDDLEHKLSDTFRFRIPVLRRFSSVEEQNDWFAACDRYPEFLSPELHHEDFAGLHSPFGFGEVLQTGFVDTRKLLSSYKNYLSSSGILLKGNFDYSRLEIFGGGIRYDNISAKHIIFAEGFGMHLNPFFSNLPLNGTKGELLIISAPELRLDSVISAGVFILPIGNGKFRIGATYNWDDKSDVPTNSGRRELIDKIDDLLTCEYTIIDHVAGIRPTVKDRKPLIGTFRQHNQVHLLNGLGTRGVMLAPAMAQILYDSIERKIEIPPALNLNRFIV